MRTPAPPRSAQLRRSLSFSRIAGALTAVLLLAFASAAAADDAALPAAGAVPAIGSQPASPGNDLAPRWSFSGPDGATFECSLTRGATLVGDWTPCTSPATYDLSSQVDGAYTFAVRSRGADGVLSDSATSDYALDTSVPPLPTILTLPGPTASNGTPAWTFAGGVGEQFECRLDRGTTTIAAWSACSSPQTFDLTGQPDGSYLFSVRGVAQDGTPGPVHTDAYLLDTRAPAAPVISSSLPKVSNVQAPTLAFSAEAGAQFECRVTGDGGSSDWAPCASPYTFDLAGKPDGSYNLALRVTDAAGNTGPEVSAPYTLDTTAPGPPATDQPSATPATRLQPTFGFAQEGADTYECSLDGPGGYATGWQPCTSPAPYDLVGQPDGAYSFAVRATDAAGNTGAPATAAYELTRDPESVDLQSSPGRIGRSRQPRWTFDATGGGTFRCSLGLGSATVFKPATCGSPRTYDLTSRPDGTYTFTVRGYDENGVARQPATQEYQLDSTAPVQPAIEAKPVSPAADDRPTWSFSGEDGAALDCRVDHSGATVVGWTPCMHAKQFDLGKGTDGQYQVTVRAHDAAGNYGAPTTTAYQLDTTPPAAPAISAAPAAQGIDRSPTWKFSGESGAVLTCTLTRGADVVAPKSPCAAAKTYNLSGAQAGTYTFRVQATDAAGNTGIAKVAQYLLAAAPAVAQKTETGGGPATTDPGATPPPTGSPGGTTPPLAIHSGRTRSTSGGTASRQMSGPALATGGSAPGIGGSRSAPTPRAAPTATGGSSQRRSGAGKPDDNGGFGSRIAEAIGGAADKVAEAISGPLALTVFPISILLAIGLFLLIQRRIDRRDPKIALAPIDGLPDLEFPPPPTRR